MPTRIVQLTDPHLLADPHGEYRGVPTRETFRDVLEHVANLDGGFDYLVLTGDLAQDESIETYRQLSDLLGPWRDRLRIVPGNHDDLDALRQVFPDLLPQDGPSLTFSFLDQGWRVIGLDSHVPGEIWGELGAAQLAWLEAQLDRHPEHPTLIFIHHPPVDLGAPWRDDLGLTSREPFVRLVAERKQIKAIGCGHVHQAFEGSIAHAAVYTTPSTAFQFSRENGTGIAPLAPGYRVFDLDGLNWRTRVERLPELAYLGV